jgi:hypothetical protein
MKSFRIGSGYGRVFSIILQAVVIFVMISFTAPDDNSKGKLSYKASKKEYNVDLKNAYFIIGPDSFDPAKKIRRLIFTGTSLESRIKSCEVMNCVDQYIEGIQVDLDAAPRILYWVNLNGQKVQYSGTAVLEAISFTTETKNRLAGTLKIDGALGGGPVVSVTFDAPLTKTFSKHR